MSVKDLSIVNWLLRTAQSFSRHPMCHESTVPELLWPHDCSRRNWPPIVPIVVAAPVTPSSPRPFLLSVVVIYWVHILQMFPPLHDYDCGCGCGCDYGCDDGGCADAAGMIVIWKPRILKEHWRYFVECLLLLKMLHLTLLLLLFPADSVQKTLLDSMCTTFHTRTHCSRT